MIPSPSDRHFDMEQI